MAGINFNDLPKNLQAKLQPYMTVGGAKTVEEAIAQAKDAKNWSPEDDKQLNALNGGANWGRTMDEYSFNSSKASNYKAELPKAKKENQLAEARRRNNPEKPSTLQTVGKYVGAGVAIAGAAAGGIALLGGALASMPAWAPLAAIGAGSLLFTSCNKIELNQEQIFTMPGAKDYSKVLDEIKRVLVNIDNKYEQKYEALLNKLDQVINAVYTSQEQMENALNNVIKDIIALLQQIQDNQINMQIDNNQNAADIMDLLTQILNSNKPIEGKLADIIALLQQIKSIGENIDSTTQQILQEIKDAKQDIINTLNTNNQEVLTALAKLDENDQNTLKILNDIKSLITRYGNNGKALGEAILTLLGKVNGKLGGIQALIEQLVAGQKQTNGSITNLIALFNSFSDATATQLNAIIEKLDKSSPDYSKKLDEIIRLLGVLDANNETRNEKVLEAISRLGTSISGDLTAILNAINALPASKQKDYTEILNAILDKIKEGNEQNDANFKAVLAKINELGVSVSFGMNKILEAIQNMPDYSSKLDAILKKMDELKDITTKNGNTLVDILNAIKDHDVKITVDVTGKVVCECNCNCGNGGVHEGILEDLDYILG